MKWNNLKEILDEEFPPEAAIIEDYIGEQINIKNDINKIMVTLDLTLDVISQANDKSIDLIIAHHPFFFGEKNELMKNDPILKSKFDLLSKLNIGVFIIHTNADFNPNSIAYMQGLAIGMKHIYQNNENLSISGSLENKVSSYELINNIKSILELDDIEMRSNFDLEEEAYKILIASGASGNEINHFDKNIINIIGEVKHHEWVKAKELNTKIIEISHFSEKIFKDIIKIFLDKEKIEVILSKEENGYKVI